MCTLRCSFLLLSGSPAPGVASPEAKDTGTCLRAASHPCGAGAPGSSHLSPLNQGSLSSFQRSCIMHYQLDSTKILRKTQENSCNIWWVLSATTNVTELLPVFSVAWWRCGRCAFPVKIHAAETTLHLFHIDSAPQIGVAFILALDPSVCRSCSWKSSSRRISEDRRYMTVRNA